MIQLVTFCHIFHHKDAMPPSFTHHNCHLLIFSHHINPTKPSINTITISSPMPSKTPQYRHGLCYTHQHCHRNINNNLVSKPKSSLLKKKVKNTQLYVFYYKMGPFCHCRGNGVVFSIGIAIMGF